MRSFQIAAPAALALAVSGCATLRGGPNGDELVGRTLQVEAANGQVSRMGFREDASVRAVFGSRSVTGRWQVRGDELCFWWGNAPRECWPYPAPFERGRSRSLTSDRGNRVTVTLL